MSSNYQTRKTLLTRLKDPNDNFSWEQFYNFYRDYVFVIVINMGVDESTAHDLVQEVFVKAWKALPKFNYSEGKGRFRGWIATIARNVVNNRFRKLKQNIPTDYYEKVEQAPSSTNVDADINAIVELEWKKFIVNKSLDRMRNDFSEKYLNAFTELVKGTDFSKVASDYDIPEPTLHTYKSRLQKRLYKEIKRLENEVD